MFLCVQCLVFIPKGISHHVENICKGAKILCIPCGKVLVDSELEQHLQCEMSDKVDSKEQRPEIFLDRLLIELKNANAIPTLADNLEAFLKETVNPQQHKLNIKRIILSEKFVVSPELRDLVLTVYARERLRLPKVLKKNDYVKWIKNLHATLAKMEISAEDKKAVKKFLGQKNLPLSSSKSVKKYVQGNKIPVEIKDLVMRLLSAAMNKKAVNTPTVADSPKDRWTRQLFITLSETPMVAEIKEQVVKIFSTTNCPIKSGKTSNFIANNFPTQQLKDLAALVIAKAHTSFAKLVKSGNSKSGAKQVKKQNKQQKAKLQTVEKIFTPATIKQQKKKGKSGAQQPPAQGQSETTGKEVQQPKIDKPQPVKTQQKQEKNQLAKMPTPGAQFEKMQNKRKRKAEAVEKATEAAELVKNNQANKKFKNEPLSKTMEKDNRQKGNIFPKPGAGKKNKRQKMNAANNARESKKPNSK